MKNLTELMKQAGELQNRMTEMQNRLGEMTVEGRSGAGMVTITMSGKGALTAVRIDPSLMVPAEREVLEDLLVAAHADAKAKAEARMAEEMAKLTGGLPLPGGFKMPF